MDKKLEEIYGKDNKNLEDYEYSSAENSFISDSDFGLNESVDYTNEEIKTNESILHHKENIDLIPSSLNLLALETSLAYVIKTISRTVTV